MKGRIEKQLADNPSLLKNDITQEILNKMNKLERNPPLTEWNRFRGKIDSLIPDSAFKDATLADKTRVVKEIREIIGNTVKEEVDNPEFAKVMDSMSNAMMLKNDVLSSAKKGTKIGFGPFKGKAPLGTGTIVEKGRDLAGKITSGNISMPDLSGLASTGSVVQKAAPLFAGMSVGQIAPEALPPQEEMPPEMMGESVGGSIGQSRDPQRIALELMMAGFSTDEAIKIAGQMVPQAEGGGDRTQKQQQLLDAAGIAQKALDSIEGGTGTGKIASIGKGISDFFGTTGADTTELQANIDLSKTLLRNALLGAAVTPSEAAALEGQIPSLSDEPAIVKQKLKTFISNLKGIAGVAE
jgi:hypothetical protein